MSRLTRDGTAESVSRDQILRHARGQGNVHFPCSADHEQDWEPYPVDPYSALCDDYTYIHTWEDQREWHRMTRMTRPDCAVMCNLINIHTYIHTYIPGTTLSRETKFSGANEEMEIAIFPVQLTTSRTGNLTRLVHTLLLCVMSVPTYLLAPLFVRRDGWQKTPGSTRYTPRNCFYFFSIL